MYRGFVWGVCGLVWAAGAAVAQDWQSVSFIEHRTYQAVHADGSSAYEGGYPLRLIGVSLLNTEDWLDPTPGYTPTYQPFQLGGQAELFIQAVNLDGTPYDPFPSSPFTDFGGTACWMGQNYGNLPFKGDPYYSYTDAEWTAELGRLNLWGGDGVTDPIRAGDLVEIRARAGLHYKGKMNVNEQHDKDPAKNFELVRLVAGFGLPAPAPISLADLKNADDTFRFDSTRASGPERYQATRVRLRNVWVGTPQTWTTGSELTVTDGTRTFTLKLGRNPSFDGSELFGVGEPFDVVGILNQEATDGTYSTDGYRLLVMNAADFIPVPEPASCLLAALGGLALTRPRVGRRFKAS